MKFYITISLAGTASRRMIDSVCISCLDVIGSLYLSLKLKF